MTTPERRRAREAEDEETSTLAVPSLAYPARTSSLISSETSEALQQSIAEEPPVLATPQTTPQTTPQITTTRIDIPQVNITMDQPEPSQEPPLEEPIPRYSMALNPTSGYSQLGSSRRMSTQSARPSTADVYDPSFYESLYKPKVKLGPRPSMSMDKRPAAGTARAVATLPAGLRTSIRPTSRQPPSRSNTSASRPQTSASRPQTSSSQIRPKSRDSTYQSFRNFPPPPPIPESSEYLQRPKSSSNSVKSLPATLMRSPGMTREKQRLMKFREMYKEKENQRAKGIEPVLEPTTPTRSMASPLPEPLPKLEVDNLEAAEDKSHDNPIHLDPDHPKSDSAVCMSKESVASELDTPEQIDKELPDQSPHDEAPNTEPTKAEPSNDAQPTGDNAAVRCRSTSSPASAQESSRPNSTRPTSASDMSKQEKVAEEEAEVEWGAEATTPSTVVATSFLEADDDIEPERQELAPEPVTKAVEPEDVSSNIEDEPSNMEDVNEDESVTTTEDTLYPTPAKRSDEEDGSTHEPTRRRHNLAPLSIVEADRSSVVSYDDDLMDELRDAEVQEALTVAVPKSPISPYASRQPSMPAMADSYRGGSSPRDSPERRERPTIVHNNSPPPVYRPTGSKVHSPHLTSSPTIGSSHSGLPRSASRSTLGSIQEPQAELIAMPKRMKLGGGVAAKIADLQRSFSRSSTASTITPTSAAKANASRKSSFMSQRTSSPQSTPPRSASSPLQSAPQFPPSGFASSGLRDRAASKGSFDSHDTSSTTPRNNSSSSVGRLDNRRISAYNLPPIETKTETISVKATIIRTDGPVRPDLLPAQDSSQLQLHESPLVISHQKPTSPVKERIEALPRVTPNRHQRARSSISQLLPGLMSPSTSTLTLPENGLQSPNSVKESSTFPQAEGSWRSIGRRRSESKSPPGVPTSPNGSMARSMSSDSIDSTATHDSTKKTSKSSRLMKRMSNSLSSIANATRLPLALNSHSVREEEQEPVSQRPKPQGFDIGDLNVQFPDTLVRSKDRILLR
jgi:hypothetical protein